MIVTKKMLADMITGYINRETDLQHLVDWAEDMLRESDFEPDNFELIRDILAHLGVADVRDFGLSWDDCHEYLHRLGYNIKVNLIEA
ncbi:MAG: hypothetical protein HZA16_10620 [Nitrospirae bacterium]|nr:hypothetical protein [Nitrospirota bacterium]